jgi:pimeloyl-ACP methyl ester carboxylesterase
MTNFSMVSARVTAVGRRWKIAIAVLVALGVLIAVNAVLVENETKQAEVTVPGGRILELGGGDLQVVEGGPRDGKPVVLVHCFTCAIDWWDGMRPPLERKHRVIAVDLLGFGGSEKPDSGYSMEDQADVLAEALSRLEVRDATVVGHSLGGTVATALAERHPGLVARLVIVDQAPNDDDVYENEGLPVSAQLTFLPVIGPSLWRVTPDFAIEDGLGAAFAPGYDVPDRFVDDFRRMTYTSYDEAADAEYDYTDERPLDERIAASGVPLLAIFGKEERLYEPDKALAAYGRVPGAITVLIGGAGHSPNVEQPALTASDVLRFAEGTMRPGHNVQVLLQNGKPVRPRP